MARIRRCHGAVQDGWPAAGNSSLTATQGATTTTTAVTVWASGSLLNQRLYLPLLTGGNGATSLNPCGE